ncbi:MAG: hypothetical protein GX250_03730, partial [Clostridiales bacterium]|nr:hypothetical protein [Clostridiales bacterium]
MKKTVLMLLAVVLVVAIAAPTGALYQSTIELGSGSVISDLKPTPTPPTYGASVEFIVTKILHSHEYNFQIVIRNTSDADIKSWKLIFNYDGKADHGKAVNTIWPCICESDGTIVTCEA